jgi:two-component system, LytTR family, sensor kinase
MKNIFTGNAIKILLHLLAWTIIVGLPLYFFQRWDVGKDFILIYYTGIILGGIIFYINYLILVPKFFFGRRRYIYFLSVFILLTIFYFVSDRTEVMIFEFVQRSNTEHIIDQSGNIKRTLPPRRAPRSPLFSGRYFLNYGFISVFLITFSLGLRVLERLSQTEKLQKELEKEKLNSELAFLKNQISPHFFFNTLNNIYSLISINTGDSQKAVLKLSKLMRYLLYDSEHGNTKLSNEIDFMYNYIDLMKLRMTNKISMNVSFPEKHDDISIPPLIFIPFIENAFKHGISNREKSYVDISMTVDKDSIRFRCANSVIKSREENEHEQTGIGLDNVTKRLNILFPDKHELKINKSDKEFEVLLRINFA